MFFETLIHEGIDVVFGLPGGYVLKVYDVMSKYEDRLRHVLARHEQGATHMADGYARASGKLAWCSVPRVPPRRIPLPVSLRLRWTLHR